MRKMKKILLLLLITCLAIIFTNGKVQAAVTVEKEVTGTNGNVSFTIKGLTLESGATYEWAIEATNTTSITNWYEVVTPNYATGVVNLTVSIENENQLAVLKATDTGYISIRKKDEPTNILSAQKVDLTLPLLKAFSIEKSPWYDYDVPGNPAYEVNAPYGILANDIQFCFERITDASIVNGYIDKDHDLSGLNLKTKKDMPSNSNTNWKSVTKTYEDDFFPKEGHIKNGDLPSTEGLYYIWFKGNGTGIKTVYGQVVVEVGEVQRITTNNNNNNNNTNRNNASGNTNTNISSGSQNTNRNITSVSGDQTKSNDSTVANVAKLPQTGINMGIIAVILLVIIIGIIGYVKLKYYKDVK